MDDNYPTYMMRIMRQRMGLGDNDNSQDERINAMPPESIVINVTAWYLGDGGWASRIANWIIDAGAKVEDVYEHRNLH